MISPLPRTAATPVPPMKIYRYFMRGLEQQMWFWGQDAKHGGNLLLRYGFTRTPAAPGGSSRYCCPWAGGAIELHSWSAGYYPAGQPGFVFARGRTEACLLSPTGPGAPENILKASLQVPHAIQGACAFQAAARPFLQWLEHYETWLEQTVGATYRAGLHPHAPVPWLPPAAARAWFRHYTAQGGVAPVPRRHSAASLCLLNS